MFFGFWFVVCGLGFGVLGLCFGVLGFGFLGFGFWVLGLGFGVLEGWVRRLRWYSTTLFFDKFGSEFRIQKAGFRV